MSYSIQRAVSDGTLKTLLLSIDFLDSSYIKVFIDNVEQALGTTWTWATPKSITFPAPLAAGVAVLVRRSTNIAAVRHSLSGGAQFTNATMDDNFLQMLHITQESSEGLEMGDLYNELDMHGYRIRNLGYAVDGGDAISLAQYKADADGASAQRELASQWAQAPYGTPVAPGQFSAYHWSEVARTSIAGVHSFKGRVGAVTPAAGDYTAGMLTDGAELVRQTAADGAVQIAAGPSATRPVAPTFGQQRANNTKGEMEWWNGVKWTGMGGSVNDAFYENSNVISADYTIPAGRNAMTAGPVTILDGVVVAVSDGSVWSIV